MAEKQEFYIVISSSTSLANTKRKLAVALKTAGLDVVNINTEYVRSSNG